MPCNQRVARTGKPPAASNKSPPCDRRTPGRNKPRSPGNRLRSQANSKIRHCSPRCRKRSAQTILRWDPYRAQTFPKPSLRTKLTVSGPRPDKPHWLRSVPRDDRGENGSSTSPRSPTGRGAGNQALMAAQLSKARARRGTLGRAGESYIPASFGTGTTPSSITRNTLPSYPL